MQTLTMPIYPGRRYRALNAVIQFQTVGIATWRDWVTKVVDVLGGRARTYDRPIISALQSAIEKVQRAAKDLGGDAVIDLRISVVAVSSKGLGMTQLLVTGTAIVFEPEQHFRNSAAVATAASHGESRPDSASRLPGVGVPDGFSRDPDVPQLGSYSSAESIIR